MTSATATDLWGAGFMDWSLQTSCEAMRATARWQLAVTECWTSALVVASTAMRPWHKVTRDAVASAHAQVSSAADEYLRLFDLAFPERPTADKSAERLSEAQAKAQQLLDTTGSEPTAADRPQRGSVRREKLISARA